MSASKARQKVQITLKVIESLSYNCDDTVVLQKLDSMLNEVERKFREKLPHHEGLLLRPALITDAAKKVSLKYKKMGNSMSNQQANAFASQISTKLGGLVPLEKQVCNLVSKHQYT